jgi:hypothetical protein
VIRVSENLFIAFYSANGTVRATISNHPDGPFKAVRDFKVEVSEAWKKEGGR